jgi:Protein of unknown function (DUF1592)/Protein of unknown function (DUF1588)/Protein of unknown function (DUF1595)/Protein of unknown function (DUF1585)
MLHRLGKAARFINTRRAWHGVAAAAVIAGCHGAIEGGPGGGEGPGTADAPGRSESGQQPNGLPAASPSAPGARPMDGRDPAAPEGDACANAAVAAGPARMRRLQPDEYANTARALLDDPSLAPHLEPQAGEIITALEVEALNRAANELAAEGAHERYAPCKLEGAADAACARGFIDAFGKAAFRRPLEAGERDWLVATYDKLLAADVEPAFTFREAIAGLAEVILQAPQHVYVHERGVEGPALPEGVRALSGHERATRLSYLLTSSTPDAELTRAADEGALATAAGVRAQAQRLLDAPAAHAMVRDFASRWLRLNDTPQHPALEKLTKNAEKFPLDSPELRRAMRTESEQLYERAFFDPDSSFAKLLTEPRAYVDGPLAELYGVKDGPRDAGDFAWVDLPGDQRAGIFTRAAFLTAFASADYQSPVLRGVHVFRHVLCQPLPDPPANVDNTPPSPTDANVPRSVRELFEAKTSDGSCQSCHSRVNPIGFTLESYDALGQWQTTESGTLNGRDFTVPVETAAELSAGDLTGPVAGAVELSQQLARSDMAHDCMVQTWFERALSREPGEREACALRAIMDEFRATSDLRALVLNLASSDSALFIEEEAP